MDIFQRFPFLNSVDYQWRYRDEKKQGIHITLPSGKELNAWTNRRIGKYRVYDSCYNKPFAKGPFLTFYYICNTDTNEIGVIDNFKWLNVRESQNISLENYILQFG